MATVEPHHPAATPVILRECHFRWAASQLELDGSLAPAERSKSALKHLEREEFDVSDSLDLAVRILATGPHVVWSETDIAFLDSIREQQYQQELRSYYRRFFALTPEKRLQEYNYLRKKCRPFPILYQRLKHLKAGLTINRNLDREESSAIQNIRISISAMFAAWPSDKGRLYRIHIAPLIKKRTIWRTTARRLCELDPHLAVLGIDWLRELVDGPLQRDWSSKNFPEILALGRQEDEDVEASHQTSIHPAIFWVIFVVTIALSSTLQLFFWTPKPSMADRLGLNPFESYKMTPREKAPAKVEKVQSELRKGEQIKDSIAPKNTQQNEEAETSTRILFGLPEEDSTTPSSPEKSTNQIDPSPEVKHDR